MTKEEYFNQMDSVIDGVVDEVVNNGLLSDNVIAMRDTKECKESIELQTRLAMLNTIKVTCGFDEKLGSYLIDFNVYATYTEGDDKLTHWHQKLGAIAIDMNTGKLTKVASEVHDG